MGYGNCVLTLATPENVEAVGDAAIHYADTRDLAAKLHRILRDGAVVEQYRRRAQERVREFYDWEYVVDRYEDLFARMCGQSSTPPNPSAAPPPAESPVGSDKEQSHVGTK